ncbi:hypothetical protein Hte_000577 [Hypoxylon texense]
MARPAGSNDPDSLIEVLSDDDHDGDDSPFAARQRCKDLVTAVFPDICNAYLEQIASEHSNDHNAVVETILSLQEDGKSYPVRSRDNPRKRKRVDDDGIDDEDSDDMNDHEGLVPGPAEKFATETRAKFHEPNRKMARDSFSKTYNKMAVDLIATEVIRSFVRTNEGSLFNAYTVMDDLVHNRNDAEPRWVDKKHPSKRLREFLPDQIQNVDLTGYSAGEREAILELRAARELSAIKDEEVAAKIREKEEFVRAQSAGETAECGCCFEEFITNQMIHCDGESVHLFCRGCMRSQAETTIGYSKYELNCMSMDGCEAGFSRAQRNLFLDKKLRTAIERIEQEAALRMAGIENLETCPFCPYAAEYPPASADKEFRCIKPGCEKVSCRLCRKESHIPKSCAEAALDQGISARHELEEAMTAALVRNCNKCKNPFLKVDGCNKIQCTKCGTFQCYVCRQTIKNYDHFNDVARGGKKGQCPLFDNTEVRHQDEVQRAEAEARRKVAEANPTIKVFSRMSYGVAKINLPPMVIIIWLRGRAVYSLWQLQCMDTGIIFIIQIPMVEILVLMVQPCQSRHAHKSPQWQKCTRFSLSYLYLCRNLDHNRINQLQILLSSREVDLVPHNYGRLERRLVVRLSRTEVRFATIIILPLISFSPSLLGLLT